MTDVEDARGVTEEYMEYARQGLRAAEPPGWWTSAPSGDTTLAGYHAFCADNLNKLRKKLKALDD